MSGDSVAAETVSSSALELNLRALRPILNDPEVTEGEAERALKEAEEHLHFLGLGDKAIEGLKDESTHGGARSTVPSPIDGQVVALHATLGQVLMGE